MGRGGEALHDWMFKGRSAAESEENAHYSGIGAVIVDRRMADLGTGPTHAVLGATDDVDPPLKA
jgi:hypothetical protein